MLTHQEQLCSTVNKPLRAGGGGGGGGSSGGGAGGAEGDFELAGEEITRWLDNCCPGPPRLRGGKQVNANTRRHKKQFGGELRGKVPPAGSVSGCERRCQARPSVGAL